MSTTTTPKTTIIKSQVQFKHINDDETYYDSFLHVDTEHSTHVNKDGDTIDVDQNVLHVSTDVNSNFLTINNEARNLSTSMTYGNLRVLNCRTGYMSTDIVADDGYIDSNFDSLEEILSTLVVTKEEMSSQVVTQNLNSTGDTTIGTDNTNTLNVNSNTIIGSDDNQVSLSVNGNTNVKGNIDADTYSNVSDLRLKENINLLTNDIIDKLKIYSFNFKRDNIKKRKHYGVIAQELQKLAPELVYDNDTNKYLSVNYIELIPHIIHKLQQQQIEINNLRKELETIKSNATNE